MTRRTQIVGIFALVYLCAAASALGWMIYTVSITGEELETRVAAIADKNAKVKMYTDFAKLIEDTQNERAILASHVLTENETSGFLTDIESLAASVGVALSTRSLNVADIKNSSFDELVITFDVEGPEMLVKNLLRIFETLPYHSQISTLTFAVSEGGTIKGSIEVKVTLLQNEK